MDWLWGQMSDELCDLYNEYEYDYAAAALDRIAQIHAIIFCLEYKS